MCGILGVVGNIPTEQKMKKAIQSISHRGPDDTGFWYMPQQSVTLAHLRLSILDLSPLGHQPMSTGDGRYIIIFNGEIYNYVELKQELVKKYKFQSQTDTEVLLYAYVEWKEKCLEKCNGMFAFAIWDTQEKELFIARDRMGEKPLYYYQAKDGTFLFASEIKALLALGVTPKQNDSIIFDYLAYGFYDHREETFFENIKKLPPANYAILNNNNFFIKPYWRLEDAQNTYQYGSKEQVHEQFTSLCQDAIRLRMRSDVPVGINISSGLDSQSIFALAKNISHSSLHLFSMCLSDCKYDECQFISPMLQPNEKKLWHTTELYPEEMFSIAKKLLRIEDEPYGGIPTIAYLKLNEKARKEKILVLLEGQGLDELLAGYEYYKTEYIRDLIKNKSYHEIFSYVKSISGGKEKLNMISSLVNMYNTNTNFRSQDFTQHINLNVLNKEFINIHKHNNLLFDAPFSSHLLNAQYRDLRYLKLPRVLRFNDHASMAYGIELRLPYLDHRLVEFSFFLPLQYKCDFNRKKIIMRDTMKKILPETIYKKQKVSFGAVQTYWFREYFQKDIMDIIQSESFYQRPYWDAQKIHKSAMKFFEGKGDNSFFLWQWINLELWFQTYIDTYDTSNISY